MKYELDAQEKADVLLSLRLRRDLAESSATVDRRAGRFVRAAELDVAAERCRKLILKLKGGMSMRRVALGGVVVTLAVGAAVGCLVAGLLLFGACTRRRRL